LEWTKIKVFGDYEKNMINSFTDLGISKNVSSVIVYLIIKKSATSRDIEISAKLRQPEVSKAMQYLIARNWVSIEQKRREGRGRPTNLYRLEAKPDEIINYFKSQAENDIVEIREYKKKFLK